METTGLEKRFLTSNAWGEAARRVVVPWVLSLAPLPGRAEVLEIGCGAGFTTAALQEAHPGWRITATDVDGDMLAAAAARLDRAGERVRVERADVLDLDYPDQSFDLVVSLGVWHHVGRWERATAEAARVLRPDGTLVLADLLEGFFAGPLGAAFPPARAYRLSDLRRELSRVGFRYWRCLTTGNLWYRLAAVY